MAALCLAAGVGGAATVLAQQAPQAVQAEPEAASPEAASPEAASPEVPGDATATEPPARVRPRIDAAEALRQLTAERAAGSEERAELAGSPQRLPLEWEDEATRAAYLSAVREYYAYREDGLRHRRRVFAWQLASSKVIFVLVVLLVLAGVYFSGVQFHITLRAWKLTAERQAQGKPATGPAPDALGGEIDASLEGLKVRSPVLGVIILSLSFLFFYLYLAYVHPIQDIL